MIRQEEIIGLMRRLIPFTDTILPKLSDLIEKYPYFQAVRLLHTLNLLYLKDSHFLSDLRKTAIHLPDRKQLFFQIESDFFDPALIDALKKELHPIDSSFELIETFLSENLGKTEPEDFETESSPVSTDYVSYFLSNKTEKEEAPPLQYQDIIDKFLEKDAASPLKIKLKPMTKSEEPEELEELEENIPDPTSESPAGENFFTETLVKIYIKQKEYSKALEIVHKLNLIYPEKSRYFADQIRFLEKLIIYTNKIK